MRLLLNSLLLLALSMCISNCSTAENTDSETQTTSILEVTTFKTNSDVSPLLFAKRDALVEADFTSQQPGFIRRQSGVDGDGNYVVAVYWENLENAKASMSKFMGDTSVADYAMMLDASSMKMERYTVDKPYSAGDSPFMEVMSFNVKSGTDIDDFNVLNNKVETDFTGKRAGFLQRLTGVDENGRQLVVVYWENKELSDASLMPFMKAPIAKEFMQAMVEGSMAMGRFKPLSLDLSNREKAVSVLNSFNTGDQAATAFINPENYTQHNLSVPDGLAPFAQMIKGAPSQGVTAKVLRSFQDGEFVFTHTLYNFFGPKAGFDIFRFQDGLIVEHWDNMAEIQEKTASGRSQTEGPTSVTSRDETADNKKLVQEFYDVVLLGGQFNRMADFFEGDTYIQHNPMLPDGVSGFLSGVQAMKENGITMKVDKLHMVLGEGNFVLGASEGSLGGKPYAYYDLFRIENGKIVEHWDAMAEIPARSKWKNDNGKF